MSALPFTFRQNASRWPSREIEGSAALAFFSLPTQVHERYALSRRKRRREFRRLPRRMPRESSHSRSERRGRRVLDRRWQSSSSRRTAARSDRCRQRRGHVRTSKSRSIWHARATFAAANRESRRRSRSTHYSIRRDGCPRGKENAGRREESSASGESFPNGSHPVSSAASPLRHSPARDRAGCASQARR